MKIDLVFFSPQDVGKAILHKTAYDLAKSLSKWKSHKYVTSLVYCGTKPMWDMVSDCEGMTPVDGIQLSSYDGEEYGDDTIHRHDLTEMVSFMLWENDDGSVVAFNVICLQCGLSFTVTIHVEYDDEKGCDTFVDTMVSSKIHGYDDAWNDSLQLRTYIITKIGAIVHEIISNANVGKWNSDGDDE